VFLPGNKLLTGIALLNGTTVGTDNRYAILYDNAGNALANSALAAPCGYTGASDLPALCKRSRKARRREFDARSRNSPFISTEYVAGTNTNSGSFFATTSTSVLFASALYSDCVFVTIE
jgi:hypothetical protein